MAYMQRPYGPGGFLVPMGARGPGGLGAGAPYAGGMMYAPAPPGMHPGPGVGPRGMYAAHPGAPLALLS